MLQGKGGGSSKNLFPIAFIVFLTIVRFVDSVEMKYILEFEDFVLSNHDVVGVFSSVTASCILRMNT